MTTMTMSVEFSQASILLYQMVCQMESDIQMLSKASREGYDHMSEVIAAKWAEWPQTKENFKIALNQLPKELRKRDFVNSLTKEMEHFEESAKTFFSDLE